VARYNAALASDLRLVAELHGGATRTRNVH